MPLVIRQVRARCSAGKSKAAGTPRRVTLYQRRSTLHQMKARQVRHLNLEINDLFPPAGHDSQCYHNRQPSINHANLVSYCIKWNLIHPLPRPNYLTSWSPAALRHCATPKAWPIAGRLAACCSTDTAPNAKPILSAPFSPLSPVCFLSFVRDDKFYLRK